MNRPVLLLVFNRPDHTSELVRRVITSGSRDVYVVADGPRPGTEDSAKCQEVREIVENSSWNGHLKVLFRDKNLGCKRSVSDGITWFLEQAGEGVILEDDCIPSPSFFSFCDVMLDRYRSDASVGMVAGTHYKPASLQGEEKIFFSRYGLCWGWATWQRAWSHFDGAMLDWPHLRSTPWLAEVVNGHRDAEFFWRSAFDECYFRNLDSWAWPWMYSLWHNELKTLHSNRNLVLNVGFSDEATHTKAPVASYRAAALQEINVDLLKTPCPDICQKEDRWMDIHHFGTRRTWNPVRRKLVLPMRSFLRRNLPERLIRTLRSRQRQP